MRPAFHPNASFFGYAGEQLAIGTQFLFDWIDKNGPAPKIEPRLVSVDILDSIAVVRLEVTGWSGSLAGSDVRMSDLLLLSKYRAVGRLFRKRFIGTTGPRTSLRAFGIVFRGGCHARAKHPTENAGVVETDCGLPGPQRTHCPPLGGQPKGFQFTAAVTKSRTQFSRIRHEIEAWSRSRTTCSASISTDEAESSPAKASANAYLTNMMRSPAPCIDISKVLVQVTAISCALLFILQQPYPATAKASNTADRLNTYSNGSRRTARHRISIHALRDRDHRKYRCRSSRGSTLVREVGWSQCSRFRCVYPAQVERRVEDYP